MSKLRSIAELRAFYGNVLYAIEQGSAQRKVEFIAMFTVSHLAHERTLVNCVDV